jgi:hypothetical protein
MGTNPNIFMINSVTYLVVAVNVVVVLAVITVNPFHRVE